MKSYTADELAGILKAHAEWFADNEKGSRANLSGANLSWTNLSGANLSWANLSRATLSVANLSGANLSRANLSRAVTWEQYLAEVVPAFLTGGGKNLADVLATGCWDCHSWENCPTHAAFGAESLEQVPAHWRLEAARFIELFDAYAIPKPVLPGVQP